MGMESPHGLDILIERLGPTSWHPTEGVSWCIAKLHQDIPRGSRTYFVKVGALQ